MMIKHIDYDLRRILIIIMAIDLFMRIKKINIFENTRITQITTDTSPKIA